MQTTGDLVAAAAELSAGVQHGIDDLQSRPPGLGLYVHGNTAAVICYGDGISGIDGHGDVPAVACQRFINGVVHDLIDQVVQTADGGRADIHTRALAHCFQTFQNLDLLCTIFLRYFHFI